MMRKYLALLDGRRPEANFFAPEPMDGQEILSTNMVTFQISRCSHSLLWMTQTNSGAAILQMIHPQSVLKDSEFVSKLISNVYI